MKNMSKKTKQEEFDAIEGCKYCGTIWYELHSEGAPCGIDDCMTFTCCDKAFEDHIAECHPNYKKVSITIEIGKEDLKYLHIQFGKREGEDDHLIPISDSNLISKILQTTITESKKLIGNSKRIFRN
jgi:hypothetical protein